MQAFEYAAPKSVKDAVGLLSLKWGETDILAGGTDLLSLMKEQIHRPSRVVSLRDVPELGGIHSTGDGVRIGSMVRLEELVASEAIAKPFPGLVQAAKGVTSPQVRAMGTVGGDLLQRPRCWYFRNGYGLLAQSADRKPLVPDGENQYHAILGNDGPAYFVNASSLAPVLIALGAKATLVSPDGKREVEIEKLYQIPRGASDRELTLKPNEILTEIHIPASELRSATYEVRQRSLMDWPLATASVALRISGGKVESARVVLGHVAPVPWRSDEAEKALAGQPLNEALADKAGQAAVSRAKPLSHNRHKVQLARVAVKRALVAAG